MARKVFHKAITKDGFFQMHDNLYVRYCSTGDNAKVHRERVKSMIPSKWCDVSIILSADSQESYACHCLNRKHSNSLVYGKYDDVEFF